MKIGHQENVLIIPKDVWDMHKAQDTKKTDFTQLYNLILHKPLNNCNNLLAVTSLVLSNCNLYFVPDSLKNLKLLSLNLSYNILQSVPSCLYEGLQTVEDLDLSFNLIQNFLVQPRCALNLRILNLSHNKFAQLPNWVLNFACKSLTELNYSNNHENKYNFQKNGYNRSIFMVRKLVLSNSCLSSHNYQFLKTFRSLEHLNIGNDVSCHLNYFNNIDSLFENQIWVNIKILILNKLSIEILPDNLMELKSLKELHLKNNVLSWIPDSIENLVNLEVLDVSNNEIGSLGKGIFKLPNLQILKAQNNFIKQELTKIANLSYLDLYNNAFEKFNFDLTNIKCVDLECNYFDTMHLKEYVHKRELLRQDHNHREIGPKMEYKQYEPNYSEEEYFEYEPEINIEDSQFVSCIDNYENWDESHDNKQKNEFVKPLEMTDSDNEWLGLSMHNWRTPFKNQMIDEDWIYSDADS